jgi:hypothetical protein
MTSVPDRPPHPKHARRRFALIAIAATLALVALLLALGPSLLSTAAGNRWLVARVNRRIAGHLALERLSIGWRAGLTLRGLVLADAEGQRILDVPRVDTHLSLLAALRRPAAFGDTTIDIERADIVSYDDGTTNLARALDGPRDDPPRGTGDQQQRPQDLPLTGDLTFSVQRASWSSPKGPGLAARAAAGRIFIEGPHGRLRAGARGTVSAPEITPSTLRLHLVGDLDAARGLLDLTEPAMLEEQNASAGTSEAGGNRLAIDSGTRLSWGEEENEAHVSLHYDLARLAKLLSPALPPSLRMSGQHTTDLHVKGRLAEGAGLRRLRTLTLYPTAFTFDRLELSGLSLHDGRIPVQLEGGRLSFGDAEVAAASGSLQLAGQIDLNAPVPTYDLATPHTVARDLPLNEELTAGPLAFLPFGWGRSGTTSITGQASVKLERAALPLSRDALEKRGTAAGEVSVTHLTTSIPIVEAMAKALGPVAWLRHLQGFESRDQSLTIPFRLEGGRVAFEGLRLLAGPLTVSMAGSVGVDGTLDVTSHLQAAGVALPAVLAIKGTTRAPDVKVQQNLQAPLEQAPGLLEKLLKKGG